MDTNEHGEIAIYHRGAICSRASVWPAGTSAPLASGRGPWVVRGRFARAKAAEGRRTYSPSKVIHRWRGGALPSSPQPTVNNFGGAKKCLVNNSRFGSIERLSTQGPEDEFRTLTLRRLPGDSRSGTLRLVVKEYSEPFADQCKLARTNLYKCFHPARPACSTPTKISLCKT